MVVFAKRIQDHALVDSVTGKSFRFFVETLLSALERECEGIKIENVHFLDKLADVGPVRRRRGSPSPGFLESENSSGTA